MRKIVLLFIVLALSLSMTACDSNSGSFNSSEELDKWMQGASEKAKNEYNKSNNDFAVNEKIDEYGTGKTKKVSPIKPKSKEKEQSSATSSSKIGISGDTTELNKDKQLAATIMNSPYYAADEKYSAFLLDDYIYFYDKEGNLYKKLDKKGNVIYKNKAYRNYDSFPIIGYGNELVSLKNNEIIIKKVLGQGDDNFVLKIYTNNGNCYETVDSHGTELFQTAVKIEEFNGARYITYYGKSLDRYIVIDETLGSNGTLRAFIKGDYTNTIDKNELYEKIALVRNENKQAKSITSKLSEVVNKFSYNTAIENSTQSYNTDKKEIKYLVELLKGGYIDIKGDYETSSMNKNPYTKIAMNKLKEEEDLFLVGDVNAIYYMMTSDQIIKYLTAMYEEGIKAESDKASKEDFLDALRDFRIFYGNEDTINELKSVQEEYIINLYDLVEGKSK